MIARFLLPALLAGVLVGLFATAVQSYRIGPLILEAETYENSGSEHSHTESETDHDDPDTDEVVADESHQHGNSESWVPGDGFERLFYTAVSYILVWVAFSLLLIAAVLVTNSTLTAQTGLIWGAAGFLIFVLAPNFGLVPELPGMVAADIYQRQMWWFATVVSTAVALYLFAFRPQIVWFIVGVGLIVAPHVFGAPHLDTHESVIPANLAVQFAVATIVSSLLLWLALGSSLGWLVNRAKQRAGVA